MKTKAEHIAGLLDHDGQCWRKHVDEAAHFDLVELCEKNASELHTEDDLTRYEFADGSAIVTAEGGWDIEGAEPFSWEGAQ